jgi:hypothetical protein
VTPESSSNSISQADFFAEHSKRDKRIGEAQRRAWADGLIASLPNSLAYQKACTREARLSDQDRQLRWAEVWTNQSRAAAIDD